MEKIRDDLCWDGEAEMYPGFQKWGSFGPLLSELGGPSEILGCLINLYS